MDKDSFLVLKMYVGYGFGIAMGKESLAMMKIKREPSSSLDLDELVVENADSIRLDL